MARDTSDQPPDLAAQERAGAARRNIGMLSPGYVQAVHPEHGEPVTFQPGELLPGWAAAALEVERPERDEHGVYRLKGPARPLGRHKPRRETT